MDINDLEKKLLNEAKAQNIKRFVIGAAILNKEKSSILLLTSSMDDFMGGIFELPSGKIEKDESFKKALIREVLEETKLEIKEIIKYLIFFDYRSKKDILTRQFNFLCTVKDEEKINLSEEHTEYKWHKISDLNCRDNIKNILKNINLG